MRHLAPPIDFAPLPADDRFGTLPDAPLRMPKQRLDLAPTPRRFPQGTDPALNAATLAARAFALAASFAAALLALMLCLRFGGGDGIGALDALRGALILGSTWWLAWGAAIVLLGLAGRSAAPPRPARASVGCGRIAVLVPVCDEDPVATFSRVAAMEASLAAAGASSRFDIAILSDTSDSRAAERERFWARRLFRERAGDGGVFYRRRPVNAGRKAGNIEEFIKRSGAAYEFALVLDADSLMEAATILEMVRRMEAEPDLGLIQTVPRIIFARSRFGRAMQFAASLHAPVFTRGVAMMQGATGPYWGHNALLRVAAMAECCGLPEIAGRPPLGGPILSHDYVEAALLARGGWRVRLDPDLSGTYEEGTETVIDHARRDRRWCQGNLQHMRLLGAAGLRPWSRFVFVQGIATYVAPLLWLAFLGACVAAALGSGGAGDPVPGFFQGGGDRQALWLAAGVLALLFAPKLLIAGRALARGEARSHGGGLALARSAGAEILLSTVVAPVLLMYQARSVCEVLIGGDGGWPARRQPAAGLSLSEAWRASRWIVVAGLAFMVLAGSVGPAALLWTLPAALPMAIAPVLIAWTSGEGAQGVCATPEELSPTPVIAARARIHSRWKSESAAVMLGPRRRRDPDALRCDETIGSQPGAGGLRAGGGRGSLVVAGIGRSAGRLWPWR